MQITELVCETAAEPNHRETDILEWVNAEISRREREVLINLGKWASIDEKDWWKSTTGKSVQGDAVEYKGS